MRCTNHERRSKPAYLVCTNEVHPDNPNMVKYVCNTCGKVEWAGIRPKEQFPNDLRIEDQLPNTNF